MKTHPESVWLRTVDVDHAKESEWTNDAVVTHSETWVRGDEIEFVPAKSYADLKSAANKLVERIGKWQRARPGPSGSVSVEIGELEPELGALEALL